MTWLVDLDDDAGSAEVVTALHEAGLPVERVAAPGRTGSGLVLCSRESPALRRLLGAVTEAHQTVIIVSGPDGDVDPWPLLACGATDVLAWEGDPRPILAKLARARQVEELIRSTPVTETILGSSAALRRTLRELVTAARFGRGPILLLGETGTGKELAARVAHRLGTNASGPLVVVDCTTIVPSLSGSELFGHERGAFTGAVSVRTGAFAAANGGTLLLDEVGELPLALQPELLRVIQEGTYKRIGSDTWHTTRFRLVGATNRDLGHEVAAGRFRADLYHRVAASIVRMPPLSDRPCDIVPLFVAFVADALGSTESVRLAPSVERILRARSYPGNLRDLRQLAARVAARHVGAGPVTPGDIPAPDRPNRPALTQAPENVLTAAVRGQLADGTTLRELRDRVADLAVDMALADCGGNVRAAAQKLGVTDRALHHRRARAREPVDQA